MYIWYIYADIVSFNFANSILWACPENFILLWSPHRLEAHPRESSCWERSSRSLISISQTWSKSSRPNVSQEAIQPTQAGTCLYYRAKLLWFTALRVETDLPFKKIRIKILPCMEPRPHPTLKLRAAFPQRSLTLWARRQGRALTSSHARRTWWQGNEWLGVYIRFDSRRFIAALTWIAKCWGQPRSLIIRACSDKPWYGHPVKLRSDGCWAVFINMERCSLFILKWKKKKKSRLKIYSVWFHFYKKGISRYMHTKSLQGQPPNIRCK